MNMYWIYDIPTWQLGVAIVLLFNSVSLLGLMISRNWIYRKFRLSNETNEAINGYFAGVGVLYGLLLGLVAVAAWQNYDNVDKITSTEATATAALYRDISTLEQPTKKELQQKLEDYLKYVINVSWPAHRKGETPRGGTLTLSEFHRILADYNPQSMQQQVLMSEALSAFNKLIEARRARLDSVSTAIPAVFWIAILVGTVFTIVLSYFFHISSLRTHLVLTAIFSSFLGSVIFLVVAIDKPFRGDVSVSPEAYESLLNGLKDLDPVQ